MYLTEVHHNLLVTVALPFLPGKTASAHFYTSLAWILMLEPARHLRSTISLSTSCCITPVKISTRSALTLLSGLHGQDCSKAKALLYSARFTRGGEGRGDTKVFPQGSHSTTYNNCKKILQNIGQLWPVNGQILKAQTWSCFNFMLW